MTNEKAIEVIRAECYVANPLDIDRAILVNTALDTAIKALETTDVLEKIKGYVNHIRNTGMGKKKSLEFIEKFIEGLRAESEELCEP